MARVVYLDCFSGISGDMFLGACVDAGLPLEHLREALGSLAMDGVTVSTERVLRAGVSATRFLVHEPGAPSPVPPAAGPGHHHHHDHPHDHQHDHSHEHGHHHHAHAHRSLPEIFALVDRSALNAGGRTRVRQLFQRLAEAEAAIHQMPVEQVHLHEVGAIDSIVDIVGVVCAMEWLAADRIVCSPLNVGGGVVDSAHGRFPVPAPATLRLLDGAPIYAGEVQKELVTPTGALIATSYATSFGPVPAMTLRTVGYGAGLRDNPGTPNVLRLLIGDVAEDAQPGPAQRVVVIECEIDDMNPQLYGVAMEQLYAAGALEVFYSAVQMKKNRPGTLMTVIAAPERREALTDIVFRETTTLGVRHTEMARSVLRRDWVEVVTALGKVRIKQAWHQGRMVNAVPEFDDCTALARTHGVAVKEVQAMALQAYGNAASEGSRA
ncbi:MAG: nickel pincer cofactor biosynthesis protein LarC [Vicinamibacterales bacterium]